MAITKAVPEVWAARILQALLDDHVFGAPAVSNREYEGDISEYGDTVHIISVGNVTIKDYVKDTDIAAPDALTDAEALLVIDQAKYFNFAIDDIDVAQTRPKLMDEAARTAGWGLIDKSDDYIAAAMLADTTNVVGGAGVPAASGGAYNLLVDLGVALTSQNVPRAGRWAIVPPNFEGFLVKDDRFVHATAQGDAVLTNGLIGRAAGFDIYLSNNIPGGNKVQAGHPMGFSFAEQILETVPYSPERRFADALKGLYVYGGKVVQGKALAHATFT